MKNSLLLKTDDNGRNVALFETGVGHIVTVCTSLIEMDTLMRGNNCCLYYWGENDQKHTYHQYDDELKKEALALVSEQNYSVAEAAKVLGISTSLIYSWKRKTDAGTSYTDFSSNEREELKHLRIENNRLKMKKYILKKSFSSSSLRR